MYKLGTCQYAVLVPLCKEAFANKEFTTTTGTLVWVTLTNDAVSVQELWYG